MNDWFSQSAFTVRLDWGWSGATRAAARGDILVVVDVLRFSTTTAVAVSRAINVVPELWTDDPTAKRLLSPLVMATLAPDTTLTLPSPNGATCCRYGAEAPLIFAGALVNATAVAEAVRAALFAKRASVVTILACGERLTEPTEDGALRFALEDYLGAGAIIAQLTNLTSSPEAKAARAAFLGARKQLTARLLACGSGIELIEKGQRDDVVFAAQLSTLDIVPTLIDKRYFTAFSKSSLS